MSLLRRVANAAFAAVLAVISVAPTFGQTENTRGVREDSSKKAIAILRESLKQLADAPSVSYEVEYEHAIPAKARKPEPGAVVPRPDQFAARGVEINGPTPKRTPVRTVATVHWHRSAPTADHPEGRFRFALAGKTAEITDPKRADGAKKKKERNNESPKDEKPAAQVAAGGEAAHEEEKPRAFGLKTVFDGDRLWNVNEEDRVVRVYTILDGEIESTMLGDQIEAVEIGFHPLLLPAFTELDHVALELVGTETIHGERCSVIAIRYEHAEADIEHSPHAKPAPSRVPVRIWIAETDSLPRQIAWESGSSNGNHTGEKPVNVRISKLHLNAKVTDEMFQYSPPDNLAIIEIDRKARSAVVQDQHLPVVKLTNAEGKKVDIDDQYQGKLVLLSFWASWCPACKLAMPGIQHLHEEFGEKGLTVIGISIDVEDEIDDAKKIVTDKKYNFTMLYDAADYAEDLGLSSIPHIFLLDEDRRVIYQHTGDDPKAERHLRKKIEERLSK